VSAPPTDETSTTKQPSADDASNGQDGDSQESSETGNGFGPGFGLGSALAALGTASYAGYRKLSGERSTDQRGEQ